MYAAERIGPFWPNPAFVAYFLHSHLAWHGLWQPKRPLSISALRLLYSRIHNTSLCFAEWKHALCQITIHQVLGNTWFPGTCSWASKAQMG